MVASGLRHCTSVQVVVRDERRAWQQSRLQGRWIFRWRSSIGSRPDGIQQVRIAFNASSDWQS